MLRPYSCQGALPCDNIFPHRPSIGQAGQGEQAKVVMHTVLSSFTASDGVSMGSFTLQASWLAADQNPELRNLYLANLLLDQC